MIRSRRCNPTHPNRLLPTAVIALAATAALAAEPDWRLVEAYLELDEAWHELDREIATADIESDEKERRRKEERGEHPDIVLAVGAARAIIETDGKRAVEAAEFLMEHTTGLSPTAESDIEFGTAALAERVGPDWSLVDDFANPKEGIPGPPVRRQSLGTQGARGRQGHRRPRRNPRADGRRRRVSHRAWRRDPGR